MLALKLQVGPKVVFTTTIGASSMVLAMMREEPAGTSGLGI
jgi:hypothetical protein